MPRSRSTFGTIRKLPSGRFQARYVGPDLERRTAPRTFGARADAQAWLSLRHAEVVRGEWSPSGAARAVPFGVYAATWLADRDLKPRTRDHYGQLLAGRLLPTFGNTPLRLITPTMVRTWYATTGAGTPTLRAHAYSLLRTIMTTAVGDELVQANPCRVRGAGSVKRARTIKPASLQELELLVAAMPARYQPMTLLAAWCGLRFGELVELRRRDVDLASGVLRIRRGAVRVSGQVIVGTPKSTAGVRDVAVPPHLLPGMRAHLVSQTSGQDSLLFPGRDGATLSPSGLYWHFHKARDAAGRPDLRWHDLRHTGAVLAASTGATLAELMARLGHSTPSAAMHYQHAAQDRDQVIAAALSRLAHGTLS